MYAYPNYPSPFPPNPYQYDYSGYNENPLFSDPARDLALYEKKEEEQITISWTISAYAKEEKSIINKIKDKVTGNDFGPQYTTILKNVSGVVKPGQLCAIMGASGAGKTTLLNVLNFRNRGKLIIEDDIRVNGKPVGLNQITQISGYVQQDDLFIGTITVREHLNFYAHLRMGKKYSADQIKNRVEEVINQVNLVKAQDTYIGMGDTIKGISGGEKRRLAFASEILTNPPLLFCDEPTSGLDAFMAMGLVDIMTEQVKLGKTIIATIHQPSSQIFENLCLLSEGRVAYFGPTKDAVNFFSRLGYQVPADYNPADFYIQTLAILPSSREESLAKATRICDAYDQSEFKSNVDNALAVFNSGGYYENDIDYKRGYSSSALSQIRWLLWRNFINDLRNPTSGKVLLFQTIFIAIFFGLIYLQITLDETGITSINGCLFIVLMNVGFMYIFPILNVFSSEIPIFYRDNKNKLYSSLVYYMTKQIAELPKYLILNFIMITIIYWMARIKNDGVVYITVTLTYMLFSQVSISFGYFIAVLSEKLEVATAILGPLLIPLILFSGFFLSNASVPDYFIWLKYLSWFFYAYDIILTEVWTSISSIPCSNPTINGCPNTLCYSTGDAVLTANSVDKNNLTRNFFILVALGVSFRTLGYIVLKLKTLRK